MIHEPQHDPLRSYAEQYCDGTLSAEGTAALEQRLRDDPQAMDFFVLYMEIHSQIAWDARAKNEERGMRNEERTEGNDECRRMNDELPIKSAILIDSPIAPIHHSPFIIHHLPSVPSYIGGALFSYAIATVILGTALAIAWAWKLPGPAEVVIQTVPSPSPRMQFVGRITGMVDCQWADESTSVPGLVAVPLGRKYALASGLLEITYDKGIRVVLQGPCTYEVESCDGGYLAVGKLTAKVEKNEERRTKNEELSSSRSSFLTPHSYFVVRTPTATVADLGTEFGVEVAKSGETETHVFGGTVKVTPTAASGESGQARILHVGETVRWSQLGEIVGSPTSSDPGRFVRTLPPGVLRLEETFYGEKMGDAFQQSPPNRFTNVAGGAVYQGPPNTRGYIRTVAADFFDRDVVFETKFHVELATHKPTGINRIFFGIADGAPNATYWEEPTHGLFLTLMLDSGKAFVQSADPDAQQDAPEHIVGQVASANSIGPGTHRLRMRKAGTRVWFAIDLEASGPFHADFTSSSFDLPANAPGLAATNSHLIVGTGNFGDMVVEFQQLVVTYPNVPQTKGVSK